MNIAIGLTQGLREILAHRMRSTIAMLAIVLGAGSLLATFALTEGIARQERRFLQALGGVERFTIRNAPVPADQDASPEISPGMTIRDVDALRREPDLVAAMTPSHRLRPNPVISRNQRMVYNARVTCGTEDYHRVARHVLATGRFLCALDVERCRPVCVIGSDVVDSLGLNRTSAIGQKVSFDGALFEIIGTLQPSPAFWMNTEVIIPYTTAFTVFEEGKVDAKGKPAPVRTFNEMMGSVRDPNQLEATIQKMKAVLLKTHRGVEDFGFDTMQDWSDSIESRITAVRMSGSVIAGVSLLVGGIGVTNVMLAAIKHRIREIGVRRAIGAHRSDIFLQIMLEAFILAILGGLLGVVTGWGMVAFFKIAAVSKSVPVILPAALGWSFGSALVTGVLAGVYPALRGAAMSPMEALRYE
ncbi:MAG: ABC transporter permease [Chthoniobacterales bacterium]